MTNNEKSRYCPYESVKIRIKNKEDDSSRQLMDYWNIIGPNIICEEGIPYLTFNIDTVNELFSDDAITMKLMKTLIRFNRNGKVNKIHIVQDDMDSCLNKRPFESIYKTIKADDNDEVEFVAAFGSSFIVIISRLETSDTVEVRFWDLRSLM